ncbi:contact-dependent growth inhibition system immunity protein [Kitasatospora griseola]|uniref:contact-dependent growth inhibition system immunity protein n=1 Tax=Kitasatospora griseola TaxID=2064 RepID=UPI0036DF69FA
MTRFVNRDRSLGELERDRWSVPSGGETRLMATVRELRRKPIGGLTVEDMRLLIGQDAGLAHLLPLINPVVAVARAYLRSMLQSYGPGRRCATGCRSGGRPRTAAGSAGRPLPGLRTPRQVSSAARRRRSVRQLAQAGSISAACQLCQQGQSAAKPNTAPVGTATPSAPRVPRRRVELGVHQRAASGLAQRKWGRLQSVSSAGPWCPADPPGSQRACGTDSSFSVGNFP